MTTLKMPVLIESNGICTIESAKQYARDVLEQAAAFDWHSIFREQGKLTNSQCIAHEWAVRNKIRAMKEQIQ